MPPRVLRAGDAEDWEDGLNAVVESRGPQPNLSFFAFTATPKGKTIDLFGRPGPSGKPEPFHVYSMRQAIEEGFILDVLQRYIDYDTYYRIVKQADDDPEFPKRRASVALGRFLSLHPVNVGQRTAVIVEHFREQSPHGRPREGDGRHLVAPARGALHAGVRALPRRAWLHGYPPARCLQRHGPRPRQRRGVHRARHEHRRGHRQVDQRVGATGPLRLPRLPGFDQPLLQAMYVDKRLDGVQAVQTLSRLNRIAPGTPGKARPFVLDFVNDPERIRDAFAPYYDRTELLETSDPYRLEDLKHELDSTQVYFQSEVEAFAQVFYLPAAKQRRDRDHPRMQAQLQPARDRFGDLDEDEQTASRDRLGAFVTSTPSSARSSTTPTPTSTAFPRSAGRCSRTCG